VRELASRQTPNLEDQDSRLATAYIAYYGIITVIHKLEKMLKEVVAYFMVLSQEFSWKG